MPTRTYTITNLLFNSENLALDGNASSLGSRFNRSSSGSDITEFAEYSYDGYAYINFNTFPTIPDSALISKVRVTLQATGSVSDTDVGGTTRSEISISAYTGPALLATDSAGFASANHLGGNSYDEQIEWEILYTPNKTKAEIVALWGNTSVFGVSGTGLLLVLEGLGNNNASPSLSQYSIVSSSFKVIVTFDLEHYSWYIKSTPTIINGQPVEVIEDDTTDIVALGPNEEIPEGYEFYGTGEVFPDGPEYVWWESEDFYELFIYSPINPSVPGLTTWTPVGGVPTCTNCTSSTIGSLDILVADASGIYTLVPNKTNDSVYTRTGFSVFVEEVEVKIPNPFGKIGFIP